jgi:hypothetical protein
MLGMETLLAVGIGVGLASVAGVRAFLPLALAAAFLSFQVNPPNLLIPFTSNGVLFWALLALAVLECALDKLAALDRPLNWLMVPVRAVAGAVLFAVVIVFYDPFVYDPLQGGLQMWKLSEAMPVLAPWLVVGAIVAGAVAVTKVLLRPSAKGSSAGVSTAFLSFFEDAVGLVGGALALAVPYFPLVFVAFLLYFFYRVRRRRGRKYGGLRILGD